MVFFCPVCWKELKSDEKICHHCGADITEHNKKGFEEKLINALNHVEPDTVQRAVWILGKLRSNNAVPHLIKLFEQTDNSLLKIEVLYTFDAISNKDAMSFIGKLVNSDNGIIRRRAREITAKNIIRELNDPVKCYGVQLELIPLGESAVEPLISFLLSGPSEDHKPRCLAAEALGIIGGDDALNGLISCLLKPFDVPDPVDALAEEAVKNCMCHALRRLGDKKAIQPLLTALERYHLVGAAEALAGFGVQEAVPILIKLLEDSFKRSRVSKAILEFGSDAIASLIKTTDVKRLRENVELLPSIERRAEAARLLGLIRDKNAVPKLTGLLDDDQAVVKLEASLALLNILGMDLPPKAIRIIEFPINNLDLERKLRAEEALCLMKTKKEHFQ